MQELQHKGAATIVPREGVSPITHPVLRHAPPPLAGLPGSKHLELLACVKKKKNGRKIRGATVPAPDVSQQVGGAAAAAFQSGVLEAGDDDGGDPFLMERVARPGRVVLPLNLYPCE